jgi:hypothetical protein
MTGTDMWRFATGTIFLPALLVLACLASLACGERGDLNDPRDATVTQAAARRYGRDAVCPIDRITATRLVPTPPAPAAIADDPERFALWEDSWDMRARTDPRMLVMVDGCGAQRMYTCWEFTIPGGVNTTGRGSRRRVWGATCLEENGYSSQQAVSAPARNLQ